MHAISRGFLLAGALALWLLPARSAAATGSLPLLPLAVGDTWRYRGALPGGPEQTETIVGTRQLLGRTVFIKSTVGGPDDGVENYWLTGAGGEVLLAGYFNHTGGYGVAYDPPLLYCGADPALGDVWTTHYTAYNLVDGTRISELDATYEAYEVIDLVVPAGTFHCVGIGPVPPVAVTAQVARAGTSFDGRSYGPASTGSSPLTTDWLSAGVGFVQHRDDVPFQLVSYGTTTSTRATTWGRLKALAR